ncbi:hypothetical protein M8818_004073 [Zalaria obscura]|uniref:Uncharacterized protein n=1 Tax=Zalaria obscura TaxID=2024903 RepID=A0ACC3SDA0_9PEZI
MHGAELAQLMMVTLSTKPFLRVRSVETAHQIVQGPYFQRAYPTWKRSSVGDILNQMQPACTPSSGVCSWSRGRVRRLPWEAEQNTCKCLVGVPERAKCPAADSGETLGSRFDWAGG